MNWDAIQAVAELVAALGVIVSLVYLAAQVRQNTRSVRAAASQDLLLGYNAVLDFSKQSAYGGRIYDALTRGYVPSLPPEQQSAARATLIQVMRVYEQAYLQHRAGMLPDDVWEAWAYQIRMSIGLPGFADLYPALRPLLSHGFGAWTDQMLDDAGRTATEYADRWAEAGTKHLFDKTDG